MRQLLGFAVNIYRTVISNMLCAISDLFGFSFCRCIYSRSCSEFALEELGTDKPVFYCVLRIFLRVITCQPFTPLKWRMKFE